MALMLNDLDTERELYFSSKDCPILIPMEEGNNFNSHYIDQGYWDMWMVEFFSRLITDLLNLSDYLHSNVRSNLGLIDYYQNYYLKNTEEIFLTLKPL